MSVPPPGEAGARLLDGRYRLGAVVRRTDTATVWHAQDEALGAPVEVRRLSRASPVRVDARARTVFSPRVTPVVDVLEQDDGIWVVSERLPGRTLEDVLEQGPLSEADAARLGHGVLDALRPVHAAGLTHGDLVPATVLIGADGLVVLSGNGMVAWSASPEPADLPAVGDLLRHAVGGAPRSAGFAALLEELPAADPQDATVRRLLDDLASGDPAVDDLAVDDLAAGDRAPDDLARDDLAPAGLGPDDLAADDLAGVPGGRPVAAPLPRPVRGGPARRRSRRTGLVAALVLACLAVLAGAVGLASYGTRDAADPTGATAGDAPAGPTASPSAEPADRPSASAPSAPAPSASASPSSAAPRPRPAPAAALEPAAPVPDDWSTYDDPGGAFSVAVPPRWRPDGADDQAARFVSGTGLSSLVVATRADLGEVTEERVRALEQAFAAERQDYRLLRLEPTTFRGVPAYAWEATFVEDGVAQRASAVGFAVDGRGHLLYLQSTERTWSRLDEVERDLRASYRVTG